MSADQTVFLSAPDEYSVALAAAVAKVEMSLPVTWLDYWTTWIEIEPD